MPISVNRAYSVVRFGKRAGLAKSLQYKQYLDLVADYSLTNREYMLHAASVIKNYAFWNVTVTFFFPRKQIFTLDGRPKRLDTSNLLKVMHDTLANELKCNDVIFWDCVEKKRVANDDIAHCTIMLSPINPKTGEILG